MNALGISSAPLAGQGSFSLLTVGWEAQLIDKLAGAIAARGGQRFIHLVHPRYTPENWPGERTDSIHFFRKAIDEPIPAPDPAWLASLEHSDVPTVHNMILSDRIVSKLPYDQALGYATFLSRRVHEVLEDVRPSGVIGAFDAIHGSIGLAVARRMDTPWFALNFSVIPQGFACFCDRMSPAARVTLTRRPAQELRSMAEGALKDFEARRTQAYAYIAPQPKSVLGKVIDLPRRVAAAWRTLRRARDGQFLRFIEHPSGHSVPAAVRRLVSMASARRSTLSLCTLKEPPDSPYVFFGLHLQPESSIDVWAPFFSNQPWVIELLARSIPPTHRLLVKIHKSDISNHPRERLKRLCELPGVEFVAPFAESRAFIEQADLIVTIQGTIGLEGALLGKRVIVLGDSPLVVFPSVSRIGPITDLPDLIRRKLGEPPPEPRAIAAAYASFLEPMMPASLNVWSNALTEEQLRGYVELFAALERHIAGKRHAVGVL